MNTYTIGKRTKGTLLLLRIFLVIFIVGIIGFLWQENQNISIKIKTQGGNITEGIVGTPRFINPVLAQSQTDLDLTRLIFSPLLTINRNGHTYYHIAKHVEVSDNRMKYTLTIKDNIFFEDKHPLSADDVIFTIKSIQDPLIKSPLASKWQGVTAEKINQYTVVFNLVRPFSDFIYNLEIGILPKHIWSSVSPQEFIFNIYNTNPIGSGPYHIDKIQTKKNGVPKKYYLKRSRNSIEHPYITSFNISFFDNEKVLIKNINEKTIDAAYGISPENIEHIDEALYIHSATLPRVFALFFNQNQQPIFASKNIRKALHKGINRKKLVQEVFNNYASPTYSTFGFLAEEEVYNPEESQILIESEGWILNKDGIYQKTIKDKKTLLSFSIAIPNIKDMKHITELIQSDLMKIGVLVTIRSYDQGNLNQNIIRPREYESLLFGYEIKKPSDMYAFWHSSQISDPGLNVSIFKNTKVDTLLTNIRSTIHPDLETLDSVITNEYPALFLYSPSYIYILPKNVRGTSFSITQSSDRFNTINKWYMRTRYVWPLFVETSKI